MSAGGLYDGLILLVDDETGSYWDHITGEALHGPLTGSRLPIFGIEMHSVKSALRRWPDLRLLLSKPSLMARLLSRMVSYMVTKGPMARRHPPGFRKTMGTVDPRLPEHERGLGLIGASEQVFLPMDHLTDGMDLVFEGQELHAGIDPDSGVPYAEDQEGQRPVQLWARWYGFSASYPSCTIA